MSRVVEETRGPALGGRPLLDNRADMQVFVEPDHTADRLRRAMDRGLNVLLVGERGSGKTSLARSVMFAARQREGAPVMVYVGGGAAPTPADLLRLVVAAVPSASQANGIARPPTGVLDFAALLDQPAAGTELLHRAFGMPAWSDLDVPALLELLGGRVADRALTVVLDDVDAAVGHALFGVYRDEVWRLEVGWLVSAQSGDLDTWLTPPADAFFETTVRIPAITADRAREILGRRVGAPVPVPDALFAAGGGLTPRELISLARQIDPVDPKAWEALVAQRTRRAAAIAELGRPAGQLASALAELGPVSPSDPRLLGRLGWTRARASQVAGELERAGLVSHTLGRSEGPGRPPRLYRLVADLPAGR